MSPMRHIAALLFALSLLVPAAAVAREEIRRFDANIEVRADGALDVTETITVNSEGREIRRGIYRDIPLRALDEWGFWTRNGFRIREILHNGQKSPHHTEWQGRFLRIYIGDPDVFILSGEHVYTIAYTTTRQLRYFDEYDELYWNVTGNFWNFPILQATASVSLPPGAVAEQLAAYTGPFGAKGGDYEASGLGTSNPGFRTTRGLGSQEGLSVAVGFTKGVVAGPGGGFFTDLLANAGAVLFALGWFAVVVYFLVVWWHVGRDPPMETVIPLFHPPENLSPAAMSYIHFKSFRQVGRGSDLAFIAALLSLGVKKWLVISERDKGAIRFEKGKGSDAPLSSGERALLNGLFSKVSVLPLSKRFSSTLIAARSALHGAISREYGGKFFRRNLGWFIPGALVLPVAFILGLILQSPPEPGIAATVPTIITTIFGWVLLGVGYNRLAGPGRSALARIIGGLLMLAGLVLLLIALSSATLATDLVVYRVAGLMIFSGIGLLVAMLFLIAAPTLQGARVLPRIEGFKLYMETAETNRLNMRDAPQMSEELYERFLPYAAGLGVEEPWSEAYAAHLARSTPQAEHAEYRPHWYNGRNWDNRSLSRATAASVAAVSAAMAASMPQPKSSSGSSGGGFSGGGGGGGGGGGW